jgi:hypothetical protein
MDIETRLKNRLEIAMTAERWGSQAKVGPPDDAC